MKVSASLNSAGAIAALLMLTAGTAALCAEPALRTKVLLRSTLSGDASKEVVVISAELAGGGSTGLHTHPGDEYATVLEGAVEVLLEGQPPKRIGVGESYHNAKGVIHETRNAAKGPTRIVATLVIDKGQPLVQPVTPSAAGGTRE